MYTEPEWSQATSQSGTIEVLKDGKIIEKIPISSGSKFLSVGRLPENNISLEHESISRMHAIIQFGPRNTGFIYDLGSTHGTFLNKKRIPSSQFIKIASGNAVIHFGASTRLFVLHLDETTDEEVVSDSKKLKSHRVIVTEFFSAHSIPFKSIISSRSDEGCFICSCDFSEYISIDSSETLRISSSGTTKDEALSNFYEDCYNFILRVGLIDAVQSDDVSDSTDDSSEDDFYTQDKSVPKTIKSNSEALSEEQIISLRDRFKAEVEDIHREIENLEMKLTTLEHEIVDDLDVYVQDLKKTELRADIEKCNSKHAAAKIVKNMFLVYFYKISFRGYRNTKIF